MNTTTLTNATEYRDVPLAMLTESTTNPRRIFEESALKEFADFVTRNKIGLLWR
jgi:ParB family transcriptional regulator, chromosome partitioning protein